MQTLHEVIFSNSQHLDTIDDASIPLIITSPPYPMIGMWDEVFGALNPVITEALEADEGRKAFHLMHQELKKVWEEAYRVLMDGGVLCVNIGDATRTLGGMFQLYSSHSRILQDCLNIGFKNLPNILWRKQTNAPNKFMGSGMLPAGAYVTLEHEYILIFRKGGPRRFSTEQTRENRRISAYFWEERNIWFSDVWTDLKGAGQALIGSEARNRSGAFPFELAYRLINMYSVLHDTVLDPFAGTGTTTLASMAAGRNSIGVEIDTNLQEVMSSHFIGAEENLNARIRQRFRDHLQFVRQRKQEGRELSHWNCAIRVPCISRQETAIRLYEVRNIRQREPNTYEVTYQPLKDT